MVPSPKCTQICARFLSNSKCRQIRLKLRRKHRIWTNNWKTEQSKSSWFFPTIRLILLLGLMFWKIKLTIALFASRINALRRSNFWCCVKCKKRVEQLIREILTITHYFTGRRQVDTHPKIICPIFFRFTIWPFQALLQPCPFLPHRIANLLSGPLQSYDFLVGPKEIGAWKM